MKSLNFGVLTGNPGYSAALGDAITQRGHSVRWIDPAKLYQLVTENERGHDRIYDGSRGEAEPERITAGSLDVIIPRLGSGSDYGTAVLRFFIENLGIWSPVSPYGIQFASNKWATLQRLSSLGVPIPRTILTSRPAHINWILTKLGGEKWIIKTLTGSQGTGVACAYEKRSAASLFELIYKLGARVIIESFVEADGKDLRLWVCGDRVILAMERTAAKGAFKANLAQGGSGKEIEVSPELEALAVKAAQGIGLNVCGVDVMKDTEGRYFVVEVNSNPGTKIIDVTGRNPFVEIVEFCERNYNKPPAERTALSPEALRLEELTAELKAARTERDTLTAELKTARYGRTFWMEEYDKLEKLCKEHGLVK